MKIEGIIFDFYGVIYDFDSGKLNSDLLNWIKQNKAQYKIAILSNSSVGSVEQTLAKEKALDLFETILVSGSTAYSKPMPQIYELMLDKLAMEPGQVIFVDDSEQNTATAESLGIKSIHWQNFTQFDKEIAGLI